jgi:3-hydroxy-9,10-secoandrosta-1,3,5(10)-triene-9,17-dione monooxygenase reductase component
MSIDTTQFRNALGSFVTGVTIVTTRTTDGTDVGLTANSFNSVSLDPPLVLWSLARTSASQDAFTQASRFAVHILASDQENLSTRFAKRGEDKFAGLTLERDEKGTPLLQDCSARFECRTAYQYDGGDHIIFVGEVLSFSQSAKRPLAFHAGRYALTSNRTAPTTDHPTENDGSFSEDFLGHLLGTAHFQFYSRIRPQLEKHGLNQAEHYILGVLGNGDGRSAAQIDAIIGYTGVHVTHAIVQTLLSRGFIHLVDTDGTPHMWLTPLGRQIMIELTATAKAVEAEAQKHFNEDEIRGLKQLLKYLINGTGPGLSNMWQR